MSQEGDNKPSMGEDKASSAFINITELKKGLIAASGDKIQQAVVDILADAEIKKRVDIAHKAVLKIAELKKAFSNINRPDDEKYDAAGEKVLMMTKQRKDDIEKAAKILRETEQAFDTAISKNDADSYDKLQQKLNQGGGAKSEG